MIIEINVFETISTSSGLRDYRFNRAVAYNIKTKKNTFLAKQESRYYTGTPDILAFLEEDEDKVLASIMHGNEVWKIDLNSGSAKHYNTYQGADYVFLDTDGKPAAYVSWDRSSGVYELKNRDKKTLIKTTNQNSMPYPVWGFTPDRSALLAFPDTETDYGLKQISLEDGSVSDIEIDGQAVGNVNDILDEYTNRLVGVGFTKDLYEQIFIDPEFRAVHTDLKSAFPDQTVWISSWSRDYSVMTIGVHSAGKPAEFYLYDSAGPSVSPLGSGAPQLHLEQ